MQATPRILSGFDRLTQAMHRGLWLPVAIFVWIAAIGLSWRAFLEYDFSGAWPALNVEGAWWPRDSRITLAQDRPTVLFFMHSKCPCTRASLAELERLWVL